ncbi:zinc finger protein 98-like [Culicoides brevitarsis]|uniref:zinc finger protein 98-like n=1 Tax=Culicoides brevitarsis TaxID=469753 RepID=UPI00307BB347
MDLLSARNCRICLSQCETRDLDISEFATKYINCTGFQITEKDIPKKICSTCTSELIQASNFQAKCQETEKILVNLETKKFQNLVSSTSDFENPETLDIIEELINNDTEEYENPVKLECDFCDFEVNCYKDIHKLKDHVTKSHQDLMKGEKCIDCPLIFPVKSLLKLHVTDSHTPNNVKDHFSCTFCLTRSLRQETILTHTNSHHKSAQKFSCCICRKEARSMDHLRWHLKHSKCANELLQKSEINFESTLNCDFCGFSCVLEANMEHHVLKMHENEEIRKCFCGKHKIFCRDLVPEYEKFKCNAEKTCKSRVGEKISAKLKRKPKLTKEIDGLTAAERKKMRQNELVECETCHEKLKRASLARHMNNIHHGVKFTCPHCEKPYTLLQNLKLHIAKHHMNLKTEYPCQYCDRKFMAWASRYYHQIRVHTKNFKFFCEMCNKHFMHQSEFDDHNSIHTGVKARECDECGEKFHTRNWLRTHKETMHRKEPPIKCNFCGKAFLRNKMIQKHLRQVHGTTENTGYLEKFEEMEDELDEYEEAERFLVEFIANQERT